MAAPEWQKRIGRCGKASGADGRRGGLKTVGSRQLGPGRDGDSVDVQARQEAVRRGIDRENGGREGERGRQE